MQYGKPNIERDMCIKCGACYSQCPRSFYSFDVVNDYENILGAVAAAMNPGGN